MSGLIDTTEMYLKTVWELQEDSVAPLRARIVDRLGHSGPTVSQTVGRMERDGLLHVARDRRIELSEEGMRIATQVIRKHRLAECLLLNIIKLDWVRCHEEACRWEHVMSNEVVERLMSILDNPQFDPYGNPIPGSGAHVDRQQMDIHFVVSRYRNARGVLLRIGEPIQAQTQLLSLFAGAGIVPGCAIEIVPADEDIRIINQQTHASVVVDSDQARRLFMRIDDEC